MKEKIYDIVKRVLEQAPRTRDDDRLLIWTVWNYKKNGVINSVYFMPNITFEEFNRLPSVETIRRSRQQIQALHTELQSTEWVAQQRRKKEGFKGTFIFREHE
jgi:hypothetical protein